MPGGMILICMQYEPRGKINSNLKNTNMSITVEGGMVSLSTDQSVTAATVKTILFQMITVLMVK